MTEAQIEVFAQELALLSEEDAYVRYKEWANQDSKHGFGPLLAVSQRVEEIRALRVSKD